MSAESNLIREHVTTLFDAFLAKDVMTLRNGRTDDWKGFLIRSTRIVRGLDDYTNELEGMLAGLVVERYDFLEFEVDLHGEVALVFYVARDWLEPQEGAPTSVLIRALDVYSRAHGHWTQIASNICAVPDPESPSAPG
jgi:ketosteroid isomerase-like protein